MVKRKMAKSLSWAGQKLLAVVILAVLLMAVAVPVVILTNAGLNETWAYLALAAFLIGVTSFLTWLCVWGMKHTTGKEE